MCSAKRLITPLLLSLLLQPLLCPAQSAAPGRVADSASTAAVAAHEQQLQAIRQALLDASLQAPTQVISTSWIDNMGALREEHQFNTKAEVRGIRLFSLGKDENGQNQTKATADLLPWGWRHAAESHSRCIPPPRHWRLPMTIGAALAPGFPGAQHAPGQALLRSVEQHVQAMVRQSARWTPGEPSHPHSSTYLQALVAPASEDVKGWQLDIQLLPNAAPSRTSPALSEASPPSNLWGPAPWVWSLHLSLRNAGANPSEPGVRWQQSYQIPVDLKQLAEHPSQWRTPIEAALTQRISAWLQGVQEQLRCEPTPFVVKHEGARLQLSAGSDSGLRSGDRVLVMQPGWVPGRLLDPRVADHLALAEVVHTGPRHTEIRQLAGPPLPSGNQWVALPL